MSGDLVIWLIEGLITIEEDLSRLNVTLNIPAVLEGKDQLSVEEVIESQSIAAVRIHVERFVTGVKKFRIFKQEIPLTLHGSVNQIWSVACVLCKVCTISFERPEASP